MLRPSFPLDRSSDAPGSTGPIAATGALRPYVFGGFLRRTGAVEAKNLQEVRHAQSLSRPGHARWCFCLQVQRCGQQQRVHISARACSSWAGKYLSKRGPLCVTRRASSSLLDALLRSGLAASSEGLPGRARCARQLRSSEQARTCPTSGRFRWMAEPRVLTVYAFVLKWQS